MSKQTKQIRLSKENSQHLKTMMEVFPWMRVSTESRWANKAIAIGLQKMSRDLAKEFNRNRK